MESRLRQLLSIECYKNSIGGEIDLSFSLAREPAFVPLLNFFGGKNKMKEKIKQIHDLLFSLLPRQNAQCRLSPPKRLIKCLLFVVNYN